MLLAASYCNQHSCEGVAKGAWLIKRLVIHSRTPHLTSVPKHSASNLALMKGFGRVDVDFCAGRHGNLRPSGEHRGTKHAQYGPLNTSQSSFNIAKAD